MKGFPRVFQDHLLAFEVRYRSVEYYSLNSLISDKSYRIGSLVFYTSDRSESLFFKIVISLGFIWDSDIEIFTQWIRSRSIHRGSPNQFSRSEIMKSEITRISNPRIRSLPTRDISSEFENIVDVAVIFTSQVRPKGISFRREIIFHWNGPSTWTNPLSPL